MKLNPDSVSARNVLTNLRERYPLAKRVSDALLLRIWWEAGQVDVDAEGEFIEAMLEEVLT